MMQSVGTALSEKDMRQRSDAKRKVALAMVEDRESCREAWVAAGFAVEFAVKALIMRQQGWPTWPDASSGLHIHSLRQLFVVANIDLSNPPKQMRASLRQVLDWERRHDYHGTTMPRKAARSMVEAAFGKSGVVEWLNEK